MRTVVLGATGNVGLALVRSLVDDGDVHEVIGVARRPPGPGGVPGVRWVAADIATDELGPILRDADVVVHLAWLIQPSRDLSALWRINVEGTERVLRAVAAARVPSLVYASSVGAYSPGPAHDPVDERWPTHGIAGSSYSRQKAYVERMLDTFEEQQPEVRVVRLRPGLIFQEESAEEQRRFFAGSLVPRWLLEPGRLPVLPHLRDVRFQTVHTDDVADAYRRAVLSDARGAFNVAAEPILSTADIAGLLGARAVPVPHRLARMVVEATWKLRLHPVSPGWVELAVRSPVLDTSRARRELGWEPRHDGRAALHEALRGIRTATGGPTPTLAPGRDLDEVRTGHGARYSTDERAEVPPR